MADKPDLIIGCASSYEWKDVKNWVNSIQMSGFKGDIVIVGTGLSKQTIDKLSSKGVLLHLYGELDEDGNVGNSSGLAPHVERFFYIHDYLKNNKDKYNRVITTDTRDVIFQTNPTDYFNARPMTVFGHIVVGSEGLLYENEPWGDSNLYQAFGPHFHKEYRKCEIFNVGVIAASQYSMKSFAELMFHLSLNRPTSIVDQAVFNVLIHNGSVPTTPVYNLHGWAIHLGTTEKAVESGGGDLGAACREITRMNKYKSDYLDEQPTIKDNGEIFNNAGNKFVVVHQYDRIKGLKEIIDERYGAD